MGSCHIAHDCKVGDHNIFANNTLLAGHVVVEVSALTIQLSFGYFGGKTFIVKLLNLPGYRIMSTQQAQVLFINFVTLDHLLLWVVVLWYVSMFNFCFTRTIS